MFKKLFGKLKFKKGGLVEDPKPQTESTFYQSSRRIKRISITPEILMNMFVQGSMIGVEKGILPGGRFFGLHMDSRKNMLTLFVEHPMYPKVPEMEDVPDAKDLIEFVDLRERYAKEMEKERYQ